MEPRFKIGDIVHIVDEPVKLASTWVWQMDEYCGCEVVITCASIHHTGTGVYNVKTTGGIRTGWQWNDEAFKEFYEGQEIDIDLMELLEVV